MRLDRLALVLLAAAHQWYRAVVAEPPTVPPGILKLAPETVPTLLALVDCPHLQVTILCRGARAAAHPDGRR